MPRISQILVPVAELDSALAFYVGSLGFALKFRDGDRYAALDAEGVTLALVSQGEKVAGDSVTFSVQVDDARAAVAELEAGGVAVATPVADGPHESRGVVVDADDNPVVLYSKLG